MSTDVTPDRPTVEAKADMAHSHPCIECHEPTPCTSLRDHRTPMCEACKADDADVWGRTSV